MGGFDSLTWALEDWFDTPLGDLPDALRQRVERELFPMPWDSLSAEQRRSVALQLDYQHDPATEQDQRFWWDFFERKRALEKQIARWVAVATPTAGELAVREARLKELRQALVRMEQQQRQARGDYFPERPARPGDDRAPSATPAPPVRYLAFPKAWKSLADRLGATPEELAAWVWMGPTAGGLAAYVNANELDPPPRFYFTLGNGDDFDYLAPLMACWFREDDIAQFEPTDRYITGKALIERWSHHAGIRPEAFIRAKIAESRLLDAHPIYGCTQGTSPEEATFPPLEDGLFALSHVEEIEAEDFMLDDDRGQPSDGSGDAVSADEIISRFVVNKNPDANVKWWKEKMRNAKRNGLAHCRVGDGRTGPGGSMWRPDAVAIWLSADDAKRQRWMSRQHARDCLRKFSGFEETADNVLSADD